MESVWRVFQRWNNYALLGERYKTAGVRSGVKKFNPGRYIEKYKRRFVKCERDSFANEITAKGCFWQLCWKIRLSEILMGIMRYKFPDTLVKLESKTPPWCVYVPIVRQEILNVRKTLLQMFLDWLTGGAPALLNEYIKQLDSIESLTANSL